MLLHGGFWEPSFGPYLERPVAAALARRGFAVWNVDYRASDEPWPATFLDAAAALDHLGSSRVSDRLDLDRVGIVGHSAGGHLALWLAGRPAAPSDPPGVPAEAVRPRLVVAQAPVADLVGAAREGVGGGAVQRLLDADPDEEPQRYRQASPVTRRVADGTRVLLVHGDADAVVPLSQSEAYAEAEPAAKLRVLPGVGHFEHLTPTSPALRPVYRALASL